MERKVILNLRIANELINKGFRVIEAKPSTKVKGKVAFIFEANPEFSKALTELSKR